jgi:hypothetical protein
MRGLGRIALALFGLFIAAAIGLVVLLPTWVESAGFRGELERVAREKLGRDISYGDVDVRFFPPRVEVADLVVSGSEASGPPAITAANSALQLSWSSLLSGRAVVDELVIEGATLRIVRTAEGIDLLAAAVPAAPAASSINAGTPVALERVELRGSTIVFDDRAVVPPVVWELQNVELDAESAGSGEPIEFALESTLQGAELSGAGSVALDGPVSINLEVEGIEASPLRSYASVLTAVAGKLDATAKLSRDSASAPLELDVSLSSPKLDLGMGELVSSGPTSARTTLQFGEESVSGPLSIDLGKAELVYGAGSLRKPAGTAALLNGTLTQKLGSGMNVDYSLSLHNASARGKIRTEPRFSVTMDAAPFDLVGWDAILPALAEAAPSGTLALKGIEYRSNPNKLTGSLALARIRIEREGAAPLVLDGFIDATGDALVPRDLFATGGSAKFAVQGQISRLFDGGQGGRSLVLKLLTLAPVESNEVFSLVDAMRDAVFGALALNADLLVPLSGGAVEEPLVERLVGDIEFQIGGDEAGGKLRGVSLLRSVFERFGALGHAALLALPMKSGKSIEDYYSEEFEIAKGTFHVENGEARTQDFVVVHEKYTTRLRGGVRLDDLSLDMRGEVMIGEELDAALAGTETGTARVIPLARVGGTVLGPTVSLRREDIAAFTSRYTLGANSKISKKIDKALGEGASDFLRGVLDAAGGKK